MKLEVKNINYAAIVVKVSNTIPLEGFDKIHAAIILGNQVIVDKSITKDTIGLYFPVECQLSKEYLSSNNLYRKSELNKDNTKKGYFEENGRVRCVKFKDNKSEGLFMPLESLTFLNCNLPLAVGHSFDKINGVEICRKYIIKIRQSNSTGKSNKGVGKLVRESKLIDGQFRFHDDTTMLYRNLHKIDPDTIISITYKMHGTSGISSKVLCKKPLKWYEKILKILGVNIVDTTYDYIYASRKVIKNNELNPNANHYNNEDIWGLAHNEVKEYLQDGMTFYYEIVGFLPYSGGYIQKDYDYGCEPNKFKVYIYRITYTNSSGKVFEFNSQQVQSYCYQYGLNAVPELFYGRASELFSDNRLTLDNWRERFLQVIKDNYNEKTCYICHSADVPEEGVVIRIEDSLDFKAYKQKSFRFLQNESGLLDKGESNIEDEN